MNRFFMCVALLLGFVGGVFMGSHFSPCCSKKNTTTCQDVVYEPIISSEPLVSTEVTLEHFEQ